MSNPPVRRPGANLRTCALLVLSVALWAISGTLFAQTDEIQVYDGQIAEPGTANLTVHNNFALDGQKAPAFPGGLVPDHTLNGVPEWAYGVRPWMEAGLYLPLYSYAAGGHLVFNGLKLRALFVSPDSATTPFFYGVNFEFSYNTAHWDANRYTQEIRGIVGWHLGSWDWIFNPILDNAYKGIGQLDFAPSTRLAYHVNSTWTLAAEEYDDFGHLEKFTPTSSQTHQFFGVFDYSGHPWSVELGIGFGLTRATDKSAVKLILSRDLWQHTPPRSNAAESMNHEHPLP